MRALRRLEIYDEAIRARAKVAVAGALRGGSSPEALIAAALRAHAELDGAGPRAPALEPACAAGCSYCCHVHVEATRPELLAIAAHVQRSFDREARIALRERLEQQVRLVSDRSDEQRWQARIPCALLEGDGRCAIYEVRPLRCRAFHSCSVEPCREAFEGRAAPEPERSPLLARARDAAEEGYDQALRDAGVSAAGQRLEAGLLALLGG